MNMVLNIRKRTDGSFYTSIRKEYIQIHELEEGMLIEVEIVKKSKPEKES